MTDTLLRQWAMLRQIPRHPCKITAKALTEKLRNDEFEVTLRSVQRDLDRLSKEFPLHCNERSRPYGWYWDKKAMFDVPGMELSAALAFSLIGQFLEPLRPRSNLEPLRVYLEEAAKILTAMPSHPFGRWRNKVRFLPRGLKLEPPAVEAKVLDTVYQALLEERCFAVCYRPRGAKTSTRYEVSPLGLVVRDGVLYLVCTLWDYEDLKQIVLHRMTEAVLLDAPVEAPQAFDLDGYIQTGAFATPHGKGALKLEARFNPGCVLHLRETHLSDDQILQDEPDGWVRLTATVPDTGELRWWLLGFGDGVEVLAPLELRQAFAAATKAAADLYQ